jgi:hypothetical protein
MIALIYLKYECFNISVHVILFFGFISNIFSITSIKRGSQGFNIYFKSNSFFIVFFGFIPKSIIF